jgi:hypothetical protein
MTGVDLAHVRSRRLCRFAGDFGPKAGNLKARSELAVHKGFIFRTRAVLQYARSIIPAGHNSIAGAAITTYLDHPAVQRNAAGFLELTPSLERRAWRQDPATAAFFIIFTDSHHDLAMNLDRYAFTTEHTHTSYEFTSEGPNGFIRKGVHFQLIDAKHEIYNLAFGDYDHDAHEFNDLSISDNKDRDKILATVAATVIDFSENHPTATVVATGSTVARTRLYRMGITRNYGDISAIFDVEGYAGKWAPFRKGLDYQAFSVKRKNV